MLSDKQIEWNKQIFIETIINNPILSMMKNTNELLSYLDSSDFYIAPASTNYHGNYKGGLCEHSLNVFNNLLEIEKIYFKNIPIESRYSKKTLILIALFHDICKVGIYKESYRNKKKTDSAGKDILEHGRLIWYQEPYYSIEDSYPLGHGEKSVIILQEYYTLSINEIMAIRWHMGGYDGLTKDFIGNMTINKAFQNYPIITLLHLADLASIFIKIPTKVCLGSIDVCP